MRLKVTVFWWTCFLPLVLHFIDISEGTFKDEQYLDSITCSARPKISIQPNKTLVMKLSRWKDYHRGLSFLNFACKFQVIAPRGYGIMAVVQLLHLRTKNYHSSSCRDYIKFEQSDGLEAGPICGDIEEGDRTEKPMNLVGPRSFYDQKGKLDVALKFDDSVFEEIQKPFKFELSFTAYTECTSTSLLTRKVRQCSNSRQYSCVAANLFCDGVINCGHRGDFGKDEANCDTNEGVEPSGGVVLSPPAHDGPIHRIDLSQSSRDLPASKTTKINFDEDEDDDEYKPYSLGVPVQIFALVSAISGALVVLLVFFVLCCIVRNLSKRNLIQRQSDSQRTIEINLGHSSLPMNHVRSEVQMHGIIGKLGEDMPPSYEAIFPEQVPPKR